MGYYNNDEPELQTIDVNSKKTPKAANADYKKNEFDEYEEEKPVRVKHSSGNQKKTKKKVSSVSVVLIILIVVLVVACALVGIVIYYKGLLGNLDKKQESDYSGHEYTIPSTENRDPENTETKEEQTSYSELDLEEIKKNWTVATNDAKSFFESGEAVSADYVKNVLLIGTDLRPAEVGDYPGNADTNILISINEKTKKIYLTSFMRDTYVYIPASKPVLNKINFSHALGDAGLLMDTLEGNFKVKIDKFVRVNINDLIEIIDAAGGIDMNVSEAEKKVLNYTYIYWMCWESIPKIPNPEAYYLQETGDVHLTGMQAVAFARIRYVGNADFERTERQRRVLMALADNCKKMNPIQLDSFARLTLSKVSTNLTDAEITSYLLNAVNYFGYTIESQRVPFPDTCKPIQDENGLDYLLPDYKTNAEYLIDTIYGDK